MRPSKREHILNTAIGIVDAKGLEALTYDSLAEATGVSKSGLVYHFPSRHGLMLAIHEHLAQLWEEELQSHAGGPAEKVSASTRLRALVASLSHQASRADLLVQLDAISHEDYQRVWLSVDHRWLPDPAEIGRSADATSAYLVVVAAEGLWLHDFVHFYSLSSAQRAALTTAILDRIPTSYA